MLTYPATMLPFVYLLLLWDCGAFAVYVYLRAAITQLWVHMRGDICCKNLNQSQKTKLNQ